MPYSLISNSKYAPLKKVSGVLFRLCEKCKRWVPDNIFSLKDISVLGYQCWCDACLYENSYLSLGNGSKEKRVKNLLGFHFGNLTVISRDKDNTGSGAHWFCRCFCGNVLSIKGCSLSSGLRKSCGCTKPYVIGIMNSLIKRKGDGESAFNCLYSRYEKGAKRRGRSFEITKEEFKYITKQKCYYCGSEPIQKIVNKKVSGPYTYNGIDRIDNNIGYVLDNCVSCCKYCNYAKGKMSVDAFLLHVTKIVRYKGLV